MQDLSGKQVGLLTISEDHKAKVFSSLSECFDITQVHNSSLTKYIMQALDAEVHKWSAGKEANIRSLISTLQYVSL